MQALKQRSKDRRDSAAALHIPSALANRHLALMSFERQDYKTCQALLNLSAWDDSYLRQPEKRLFAGKLEAVMEAGAMKSLLAIKAPKERKQATK